ncbi:hypothetical protein Rsw2DRAFT_3363 [Rhodobacter ferrooxidans]|uniref:Uncharacterized protein n=1 Tax=Rhodobacter ferrooxidans TaxID=371731 RepID=C8S5N4_9RHOB|nr:hypothetical protein Rsw2DRAFT_3363 [Rhodobacter sp. SW2]
MALSAVMRRIHEGEIQAKRSGFLDRVSKRPAVPHGLRSTFRDWVAGVIPPFLTGCIRRTYAAIFSFWAGVMPPMPKFGRLLL